VCGSTSAGQLSVGGRQMCGGSTSGGQMCGSTSGGQLGVWVD